MEAWKPSESRFRVVERGMVEEEVTDRVQWRAWWINGQQWRIKSAKMLTLDADQRTRFFAEALSPSSLSSTSIVHRKLVLLLLCWPDLWKGTRI
ncbi:hypothetical protein Dimus_014769 [Dionaea muscipula]